MGVTLLWKYVEKSGDLGSDDEPGAPRVLL